MTSLPNGDALSGDLEEEFYNALLKAFHVEHGGRSGSTSPMKETLDTMHRSEETLVESQLFQALEDRLSIESEWLPTEPASGVTRKTDRAAVLRLTNRKETREKEVQVTPLSSVQEVHPNASPKVAAGDRRLSADRPRLIVKQRPGASTVVQQYDLVSLQEQRKGEAEVESVLRVFDLFINSALKQHCDEPTVEEELIENSQSNHHPHIHNSTEAVEEDEYTVTFSNNHNNMVGNEFYYSSCRSNSVEVVSPSMLDANVHNRLTHFNYTGNVFNPTSASNNNNNNNHIGSNSHLFYDDDEEDAAGGEVTGENSNVIISSVPAPRNPSVNSTASAAGHHPSGAAVYSSHTKLMLSPPSSNLTSPMLAHRPAALQGAPPVEANPTSNTSQQREAVASFEQAIVNASQANSGNRTQSQNRETLCRAPSSSNSEAFLPPSGVKAASPTRFPPSSWQRFPLFAKLLGKYLYDNFFSLEKITKKNSVGTSPVNETIGTSGNDGGGEKMTPIVLSTGLASLHRIVFNFIQERLLEHVSKSASGDPAESAQSRIVTPWWLYLLVTSGVLDLALAIQSGEENESSAASSSLLFPVLDLVLSTADSTARLFVNEQTGLLETLFRPNHPIVADKIGSSSSFSPGKVTSRTTGESTPNTRSSSVRFSQEPPLNSPTRVAQGTEYTLCAMPPIDKIHQGDCPVLGGASDEEGPDGSPTNVDPILCSTASGAFTRTSSGGLAAGRLAPERTSVSYLDNSSTLMNSRSQPGISARSNNRVAANLSVDHFTNQALFSFMEGFREKPPREEFRAIGDSMSVVMCTPERSERGDSTATPMLDVCASSNGLPNPDGPTTSEVPPIAPRGLSQLGQIERQMSEAKPALQFAVKLGALYATLDIDALMPLLPAHTEDPSVEESLLNVEPQSSMDQETATDSSKRQTMRGSVVTKGVSVLPSTFVALRASLQEHLDEFVLYIAHHYPPAALLEADTAASIMLCISLIVLSHIIGLCKEVFFTWDRVRRKSRFFTVTSITESLNRTLVSAATLALKQHRVLVADWIFRILPNIFDASSCPLPPVLVADPRTDLLIPKMDSFPVEWLSGFVQVADTAKHLLRSGHHAPQALVDVTWHLAGLASYFMGMRRLTLQWLNTEDNAPNKLNDMLLLASHRDGRKSAAKRARADTLSGAEVGLPSSGRSNAKQEEEQMQKTHDETIEQQKVNEEKLTSYVRAEIIAPLEKAMPPILSFMEVLSQSFFAGESTLFEDLRNRGSAGSNSGSGLDEEEGEDSESHELLPTRLGDVAYEKEPNHFLELCVHYFLEILDILLESAQLIPAPYKPLSLCALCMSLSSHPLKRSAEADWFAVVPQGSEFTRSPPHPPLRTSRPHAKIEDSNFPTENNLGRIQLFISLYCHNTLLEAVNIFANGSANREAYGLILENEKHSFIELVNRSLFGDKLCCTPYLTVDTMWWPSEPFSITKHTARVVQHGQLISTLFIDRAEKNTTNCLDMQEKQCETRQGKYEQRHSERVFTSILTPLLDASNGVGAVVLSLGCERPKILTMNSINGAISSSNVNANHSVPVSLSGTITHSASAPKRRSIQRSLTLTKRGLWFRVHVLRTIAAAALPTDADLRGRFRTSIKRYAMSLNERSAATHYSKLGSLFSVQYSLLTSTFSRTYVRLIFLRIVQAFNSDRSPIHCGSSLATSFPAPTGPPQRKRSCSA
ncbi:hypothetical protein AGDE_15496 [Angomonas deanei]|uniref:Uncharacterized protein n=1 Tax=Angomonas deanei TaxID=59799 RepID=A0A7G2C6M8_9TRYP|nr:hypothetical protein AGDE_15496 [Angomonas deanei]CAD2214413.1 hypothetical protein, conserved [Angomonas deanei]|eukprot:EPY18990.1 hypothetical protein AGDE_15496 [Angomonas deanei]